MKLTFPHMGNFWVPVSAMLRELGIDPVLPPPTGPRALSLGTRYAPESACYPLKLNVGNLLEALELGAEAVLMAGGSGPCRFGYYAQVQQQVFRDIGIDVDFYVLEPPQTHMRELLRSLSSLLGRKLSRIPAAFRIGWAKASACDHIVRLALLHRPFEKKKGSISKWLHDGISAIDNADTSQAVRQACERKAQELDDLLCPPHERTEPIRVGIVGEIFMIMDPFANLSIEEKLGHLGAVVDRKIFITDWIRTHLFPGPWKSKNQLDAVSTARPYLNHFVGGDGIESVGYTVLAPSHGIDGIIHILPFTCMPEIVARSVLPLVSRDKRIPVLSLSFDEHTADAGLMTRLEAFLDLIKARKEGRNDTSVHWS